MDEYKLTNLAVLNAGRCNQISQNPFSIREALDFWKAMVGGGKARVIFDRFDIFPTPLGTKALEWDIVLYIGF